MLAPKNSLSSRGRKHSNKGLTIFDRQTDSDLPFARFPLRATESSNCASSSGSNGSEKAQARLDQFFGASTFERIMASTSSPASVL